MNELISVGAEVDSVFSLPAKTVILPINEIVMSKIV